jgi:hypothetical protein
MTEHKRNKFNQWPLFIVATFIIIVLLVFAYFSYFLPSQLGSSVSQNFNVIQTAYNRVKPLINELDSDFNSISILNVTSETFNQRKQDINNTISDINNYRSKLKTGLDKDTNDFYNLSRDTITNYEGIAQRYLNQLNYYECLLGVQSETNNNWSQVAAQALQINQDTIPNEGVQKSALDAAGLVIKNADIVLKYKDCFTGDYNAYKTGEVETAITQTSELFRNFGEGYKLYFEGKSSKPEDTEKVNQGKDKLNSVKIESIPTFEKKFTNAVFDRPGQDFGRKEVDITSKYREVVERKNELQRIYKFN